jgi:hypothetical protein
VGAVVSGPFSEALVVRWRWRGRMGYGYGTEYGALIILRVLVRFWGGLFWG